MTIVVMLPMLFLLARYTDFGPVQMYLCVKLFEEKQMNPILAVIGIINAPLRCVILNPVVFQLVSFS